MFHQLQSAVSNAASKAMRQKIHGWRIHLKSDVGIDDLSRMFNPVERGWINYYGRFYKSQLYSVYLHRRSPDTLGPPKIQEIDEQERASAWLDDSRGIDLNCLPIGRWEFCLRLDDGSRMS